MSKQVVIPIAPANPAPKTPKDPKETKSIIMKVIIIIVLLILGAFIFYNIHKLDRKQVTKVETDQDTSLDLLDELDDCTSDDETEHEQDMYFKMFKESGSAADDDEEDASEEDDYSEDWPTMAEINRRIKSDGTGF